MLTTKACEWAAPRLSALLYDDETTADFQSLSKHVETCHDCQARLTELASDPATWDSVRDVLSEDGEASPAHDAGSKNVERMLPELLRPAGHPEMLGRIGRYDVENVVGAGGMGVVLKGFDTELNRPVAIKVLARHLAYSGAARQRFAREARAAAAVVHDNVVAIHNVETDSDQPYLVMQYIHGESLQARVGREGPLSAKEILRIGIQAAAGLAAAHEQGVVHRDVKPGNILLENGVERALLTDFGLARTVDDASLTHTGVITGTPDYMSPEQARGQASDDRSDLFSLGAVLYFMATAHPPFRAERAIAVLGRICNDRHRRVWEVNDEIPDALCEVIDRLLSKKPQRRYASAAAVKQTLTRILADIQRRGSSRVRLRRRLVKHRWPLAGASALLAIAAAVPFARSWIEPSRTSDPLAAQPDGSETPNVLNEDVANRTSSAKGIRSAGKPTAPDTGADAFDTRLYEIHSELHQLELTAADATYLHLPDDGWTEQMAEIDAALQRAGSPKELDSDEFATPFGPRAIRIEARYAIIAGRSVSIKEVEIEAQEKDRKIKIVESREGHIKMKIVGKEDDVDATKEFEAESAEDLKKRNPEAHKIYEKYSYEKVSKGGRIPVRLRQVPAGPRDAELPEK